MSSTGTTSRIDYTSLIAALEIDANAVADEYSPDLKRQLGPPRALLDSPSLSAHADARSRSQVSSRSSRANGFVESVAAGTTSPSARSSARMTSRPCWTGASVGSASGGAKSPLASSNRTATTEPAAVVRSFSATASGSELTRARMTSMSVLRARLRRASPDAIPPFLPASASFGSGALVTVGHTPVHTSRVGNSPFAGVFESGPAHYGTLCNPAIALRGMPCRRRYSLPAGQASSGFHGRAAPRTARNIGDD